MDSIGVLMMCPMSLYLEQELDNRFKLFKLWNFPEKSQFLAAHAYSINAVVSSSGVGPDADLIESLPNLEIVATYSVGHDKIDLEKCREKGIRVTNTPDVLTEDVADLAIALILALLRRVFENDRCVRVGLWKNEFKLTTKFSGKSVGIIGLGRIGGAIARRAEGFGYSIGYYSRSKKPESRYKYYSSVVDLASNSQILVVSCALTRETHHIVNRKVIDALGHDGVLINIGRGESVDESEMVSALVEGRLHGARLDVFEHEPNIPKELIGLDNVVLSPHVGSGTIETRMAMADLLIRNLVAHFFKKPLLTPVV